MEKGEIAQNEQFHLFPQCFPSICILKSFNSLPNNTILDVTKLKAFADDKTNVAKMMISVSEREENILGKGENAGDQLSHNTLKRLFS